VFFSEHSVLLSNRKLHMRFRLTPRSMTLDDHELYKFKFSENFDTSGQGKQHNKTTTVPQPRCRQLCRKVGRHTTKHHKQDSTSNVYDSQSNVAKTAIKLGSSSNH